MTPTHTCPTCGNLPSLATLSCPGYWCRKWREKLAMDALNRDAHAVFALQQNEEFSQMILNRDEFIRQQGLWEDYMEWIKTNPPPIVANVMRIAREQER